MENGKSIFEINPKEGDVIEYRKYNNYGSVLLIEEYTCDAKGNLIGSTGAKLAIYYFEKNSNIKNFHVVSRNVINKVWGNLTETEKFKIYEAKNNGEIIQFLDESYYSNNDEIWEDLEQSDTFYDDIKYRIKPMPKVVTVPLMADFKEIGKINMVGGVVDEKSVKFFV